MAASAATARREQQGWTESQNTENSDDALLFCHFCVEEEEFSTHSALCGGNGTPKIANQFYVFTF